ncbi:PKD-like family lipoprotein [uncultured Bacteroides sp.]|uniref:PKD-like family lipoprotein n=1 Tax=uncultured Bacteroides sp. TaxID=162156 RepID=UPI002AA69470|nr:PKD-like family lipoprotein [uncultured Bacteroides sp.]
MKKINGFLIGLFSLLVVACFEDNSSEGVDGLVPVVVDGLETRYDVYTFEDVLSISPTVQNENRYNFYWLVYSTNFNVNEGVVPKADTLSYTKNLDYEVLLDPGQYILVFNAVDKETGVTKKITSDLYVSTLNMNGWYLLKTENDQTDFDFIYSGGRINNWIRFYNGKSMEGNAVKAIYVPQMKPAPTSSDLYNTLFVLSDEDAGIYRIDNGLQTMNFESMFFSAPVVKKPQNVLQPMATQSLVFINDGKMYGMTKGGRFSNPPVSTYKVSPMAVVAAMLLGFDENSKSMIISDNGNSFRSIPSNSSALTSTNADIVWMAGYAGSRSAGMALLKKTDGSGNLLKLNMNYGQMSSNSTPALYDPSNPHIVPASHGLMNADVIAGNYDNDYVYYAVGSQIYVTDIASLQERLQITLPVGETVTCMQHVKYPDPPSTNLNVFVVASVIGDQYKVRFYDISSIGGLTPSGTQSEITGNGRIASVIYMEQGTGTRIY